MLSLSIDNLNVINAWVRFVLVDDDDWLVEWMGQLLCAKYSEKKIPFDSSLWNYFFYWIFHLESKKKFLLIVVVSRDKWIRSLFSNNKSQHASGWLLLVGCLVVGLGLLYSRSYWSHCLSLQLISIFIKYKRRLAMRLC